MMSDSGEDVIQGGINIIVVRDIKERARSVESVLLQYNLHVKKAFDEFIKPTMKYADIIIPYGRENSVAIEFVVENIKTRLKKMGIQPEERWPLSPVIVGKAKTAYPFIVCGDMEARDVYEVTNKLLSNSDPSLKQVWLESLSQKLVRPTAKAEKLSKRSFDLIRIEEKAKEGAEVVVIFQYAILSAEVAEKVNAAIEKAKTSGASKIVVLAFYSIPEIAQKIKTDPKVSVYTLICNPQIEGLKDVVLNEAKGFKSPCEEEYYHTVEDELSIFH